MSRLRALPNQLWIGLGVAALVLLAMILVFGNNGPTHPVVPTASASPAGPTPFPCPETAEGAVAGTPKLTDVGVASFSGSDRVSFTFSAGHAAWQISRNDDPAAGHADVTLQGKVFLLVKLSGLAGVTYKGPTDIEPIFPQLRHLYLLSQDASSATWIIGLVGRSCLRVEASDGQLRLDLTDPDAPGASPTPAAPTSSGSPAPSASAQPSPGPSGSPNGSPVASPSSSPAATRNYTVKKGDTLSNIAGRFGTTVAILEALNGISSAGVIHVGQVLKLP